MILIRKTAPRTRLADRDYTFEDYNPQMWSRFLMLGFLSAHIPFHAISNLELRRAFLALRTDIKLPSASNMGNLCSREYGLTLAAIKRQLPDQNKVSLALDGWTSCNRLAIESVIGYYIDRD